MLLAFLEKKILLFCYALAKCKQFIKNESSHHSHGSHSVLKCKHENTLVPLQVSVQSQNNRLINFSETSRNRMFRERKTRHLSRRQKFSARPSKKKINLMNFPRRSIDARTRSSGKSDGLDLFLHIVTLLEPVLPYTTKLGLYFLPR